MFMETKSGGEAWEATEQNKQPWCNKTQAENKKE